MNDEAHDGQQSVKRRVVRPHNRHPTDSRVYDPGAFPSSALPSMERSPYCILMHDELVTASL